MVEKKSVNVNWQMAFVLIPFLDLYASYRIQKLRLWLLIFLVGFSIVAILMDYSIFGLNYSDLGSETDFLDPAMLYTHIMFTIIALSTAVFVIRKWSIDWNKKLSKEFTINPT